MEPSRSQHDIITLRNIDDQDFTFEYDRSRGNYPYVMKAGEISRYPRFLAEHALKKLIDKILDKQKVKLNNEPARAELRERIFVEEEVFQHTPQNSESEKLRKEVENLNKPSDLESILTRNAAKEKAAKPTLVTPTNPVKDEDEVETEKFAGLEDERVAKKAGMAGETVDTTEEVPVKNSVKPTRQQLLSYGENKLGLTLDKKTMARIDKLTDDQLIEEFQFPVD